LRAGAGKCDSDASGVAALDLVALVIGAAALAMLGGERELPARLGGFRWPAFVAALGRSASVDATPLTRLATLWFAVGLGLVYRAVARRRIRRGCAPAS
jgi:hypothetical protein